MQLKKTPYSKRTELLHNMANLLKEKKKELDQQIILEMGKLIVQAEVEITLSIEIFDYYATNAEAFLSVKI